MRTIEAQRLSGIPESIFTTISQLAFQHNAVNLGQGFPDFDGPEWLMQAAYSAMKAGKNQYAPSSGIFSLRKEICENQNKYYGLQWDNEKNVTITSGATEAIYATITALVDEGDEVIMFEPFYDSYQAVVKLAGGVEKYVTLKKPDFHFDFDELEALINKRTKIIIINTPHNPSGKIFNNEELQFIAKLAVKNDLIVVSDEVYEFLTYDGIEHRSIAEFPEMMERTVIISSTGKTFSMTGWKIGWAIASEIITGAIRKVHQWTTFASNTPAQQAMAFALTQLDSYIPEFRKMYLQKRDLIYSKLLETRFTPYKPYGSYFILADMPEDTKTKGIEFAKELIVNSGVATIPVSIFYKKSDEGDTMIRLCFAKSNDTISKGIDLLRNV